MMIRYPNGVTVYFRAVVGREADQTPALPIPFKWLSPRQVADLTAVEEDTVRGWIARHGLPASHIGRRYRVSYHDLVAFMEQHKSPPGEVSIMDGAELNAAGQELQEAEQSTDTALDDRQRRVGWQPDSNGHTPPSVSAQREEGRRR